MKFRAFIDNMSDSFSSKWNNINYMGVGETLKKYQGFDRGLTLGFTVAALSQAEMFGMYEKLKYLASSITPTYSDVGYMTGNLIELTIGDWCKNQPGILESFTYDIPEEGSWELKIGAGQNVGGELPMMIKVTGFKFFPIYDLKFSILKLFKKIFTQTSMCLYRFLQWDFYKIYNYKSIFFFFFLIFCKIFFFKHFKFFLEFLFTDLSKGKLSLKNGEKYRQKLL